MNKYLNICVCAMNSFFTSLPHHDFWANVGSHSQFSCVCKCYSRITYSEIKSMTPSFLISSGNEMEHYDFCRKKVVIHTYVIWDEMKMKNRQCEL